jgi:hypothetical protein
MKLATLPYRAIYASILMHFVRKIITRYTNASAGCGIHVPESYDGLMLCLGFSSNSDGKMNILVPIKEVNWRSYYDLTKLDNILGRHGYEPDMKKTFGCFLIPSGDSYCKLFRTNALAAVSNKELAEMKRIAIANIELVKERSLYRGETL